MAAVGELASLVTLTSLAIQLAQKSHELCHNFIDAPNQLRCISARTVLIRSILEELRTSSDDVTTSDLELPKHIREILQQSLHSAWDVIIEIQKVSNQYNDGKTTGKRLKWSLVGKNLNERLLR